MNYYSSSVNQPPYFSIRSPKKKVYATLEWITAAPVTEESLLHKIVYSNTLPLAAQPSQLRLPKSQNTANRGWNAKKKAKQLYLDVYITQGLLEFTGFIGY